MNYEFHEYAAVFPLMDEAALVSLAADISANGLREPVRIFENKILDDDEARRIEVECCRQCETAGRVANQARRMAS